MLNTEHFVLLAGHPVGWDRETRRRVAAGESLCRVQEHQYARGRRTAVLGSTLLGWSVRSGSGLDGFQILAGPDELDGSLKAAMEWGKDWANRDPLNREFIAAKKDTVTGGVESHTRRNLWTIWRG